jgi:uncharacterized membrane protein (DUF485 family)
MTVQIYVRHFLVICIIAALPTVLFDLWYLASGSEAALLLSAYLGVFGFAAVSIAMSDICRGNRPSIRRTYRRLLSARAVFVAVNTIFSFLMLESLIVPAVFIGKILGISKILGIIGIVLGLVLGVFLVLGWVFSFVFVPVISAIEEKPGILKAARRSFLICHGHRGRVILLLIPVGIILSIIAATTIFAGSMIATIPAVALLEADKIIFRFLAILNLRVVYPLFMISIVLIYYDLRTRKEGFTGNRLLVQELNDD